MLGINLYIVRLITHQPFLISGAVLNVAMLLKTNITTIQCLGINLLLAECIKSFFR